MKLAEAAAIIGKPESQRTGYMVHFERKEGRMLIGDYFPDKHAGETLIQDLEDAWCWARLFAAKMKGSVCNVYVIGADFVPVAGYRDHVLLDMWGGKRAADSAEEGPHG